MFIIRDQVDKLIESDDAIVADSKRQGICICVISIAYVSLLHHIQTILISVQLVLLILKSLLAIGKLGSLS